MSEDLFKMSEVASGCGYLSMFSNCACLIMVVE